MIELETLSYNFLKMVAMKNKCNIEDLMALEQDGYLIVQPNKHELFKWLYYVAGDEQCLLEKVMQIEKSDFDYGETIEDIIINKDDRIFVDEKSGIAVFVY